MSITGNILREEHRSLVTVVHCVQTVLGDMETKGSPLDFELFRTALLYLTSFLYEFHHPKETGYLFPALRRRAPARATILDELERQHDRGGDLIADMRAALDTCERGGEGGLERFKAAVDAYQAFEWAHIRLEEKSVLPARRRVPDGSGLGENRRHVSRLPGPGLRREAQGRVREAVPDDRRRRAFSLRPDRRLTLIPAAVHGIGMSLTFLGT